MVWFIECRLHYLQIGAIGAQSLATVLETNKVLEHLSLNNCDLGDDGVESIANGELTCQVIYFRIITSSVIFSITLCNNCLLHFLTHSSLPESNTGYSGTGDEWSD